MPSGSFSKRARSVQSVTNKKNCGGNKKAGLAPRSTGPVEFRNNALNKQGVNFKIHQAGLPCPETYRNNPGGQCAGGVGTLASTRVRGCRNLVASATKNNIPTAEYSFSYYYDGPDATPIPLKGPIITFSPDLNINVEVYVTAAQSININNQIVGAIANNQHELFIRPTPVFWRSPSTEPIRLKGIDGGNVDIIGIANDINDNGEIVGLIVDNNIDIPVYWSSPTSNALELASFINFSRAFSINNSGNIVGIFSDNSRVITPVYWDKTSRTTNITILQDNDGNNAIGNPAYINNKGEIVGDAKIINDAGGTIIVPFYWSDENTNGQPLKDKDGNTNTLAGKALSINDNSNVGNNNIVGVQNNKPMFWKTIEDHAFELNNSAFGQASSININNGEKIVGGTNAAYWGNSKEEITIIRTPFEIDFNVNVISLGNFINNNGNFILRIFNIN